MYILGTPKNIVSETWSLAQPPPNEKPGLKIFVN